MLYAFILYEYVIQNILYMKYTMWYYNWDPYLEVFRPTS